MNTGQTDDRPKLPITNYQFQITSFYFSYFFMALVFDIETVGADFDRLGKTTQDSLTRWIRREAGDDAGKYEVMFRDLKEGLGFSPLTGEIVAFGVYDTDKRQGAVYFQAPEMKLKEWSADTFIFKPRTEAEMLKSFWRGAKAYREFVSFNGRSFDAPFIMLRSAVHKIKPTKNLMSNRYLSYQPSAVRHIDLLDQLSFYGAVRRRGNLHLYCQALGIKSPKAFGVSGDDIKRLFQDKEYKKIAAYNSWDLLATAALYKRWEEYVKISNF